MGRRSAARLEHDDESGAVLPLVTLMLVVLIGMAAFATDLGWMFVNTGRIQRTAEAAALSSVVELPSDPTEATAVAIDVAVKNGYAAADVSTQPMPGGVETRMQVTITDTIDLFFLSIFGFDTLTITRQSTAEYFPPLPLASRGSQFGNTCAAPAPCGGPNFNFWANIHGRDTSADLGDAYSSRCAAGEQSGNPSCAVNPEYRPTGYLYGIEATPGVPFTVEFTDLEFRWDDSPPAPPTADDIRTGDRGCELDAYGPGTGNPGVPCGPGAHIELFGPDATPLDYIDNPALGTIHAVVFPEAQVAEIDPYVWGSQSGFTVSNPTQGIYVLRVATVGGGGTNSGLNRYSIQVTGSARIYGIGDISLFAGAPAAAPFDLAEVDEVYRGKTLVVEMFDLGDEGGNGNVEIRDPAGNLQATLPANSGNDGLWVRREILIADNYTCGSSCWWTATYSVAMVDTTTWRVYVEGAPIRVIPNT